MYIAVYAAFEVVVTYGIEEKYVAVRLAVRGRILGAGAEKVAGCRQKDWQDENRYFFENTSHILRRVIIQR